MSEVLFIVPGNWVSLDVDFLSGNGFDAHRLMALDAGQEPLSEILPVLREMGHIGADEEIAAIKYLEATGTAYFVRG